MTTLPPLAVADDHVAYVELRQHQRADLAGERALGLEVAVLGAELERGATGTADHQRHPDLAVRHVAHLRGRVDDLIDRQQREVERHHLDYGAEPDHRRADPDPGKAQLGDRGVDDAHGAELLQQAAADLVGALVDSDLLTHEEDAIVQLHLFPERLVQRVAVGEGRHQLASGA